MSLRSTRAMRAYWEERARLNPVFYVDTTTSWDAPDMARFFADGHRIVEDGVDRAPVAPERHELAVEIGCGLGRVSAALAQRFERVVGVDISEEMVRRGRELVEDQRVELRTVDGASLRPLADGSVDLVFSFTVFQHIPDAAVVEAYIAEAGRVLRPGGVLGFQWNNTPGALRWRARRTALDVLQRAGIRRDRYGRDAAPFLGSRIPLDRVAVAVERAGMELRGVRGAGTLFAWAWAVKR